jgi:hypothetical protein
MERAGHLLTLMNLVLLPSNGSHTINNKARSFGDKCRFSFSRLYERRKAKLLFTQRRGSLLQIFNSPLMNNVEKQYSFESNVWRSVLMTYENSS